jgi:GrpB-like predicted nucleotidyltransferase (UPF0157 family)
MRNIVIEDYNIKWVKEFELLKRIYIQHMKHLNIDVQHVGSTSVPGCAAKPILDIDIIIDDVEKFKSIFNILNDLGYNHLGDLGVKRREAFKRKSNRVPYYNNQDYQFAHNLYVCIEGTLSLENHLRFRDYLRKNREAVIEYSDLKKELATRYENDIENYCEKKTKFITDILTKTGLKKNDILEITLQNKK